MDRLGHWLGPSNIFDNLPLLDGLLHRPYIVIQTIVRTI